MKECIVVSVKILSNTTDFNIDNNKKCFFEHKFNIFDPGPQNQS